jgi:septal ring factor EnvC (AmiA/AmiB activator)
MASFLLGFMIAGILGGTFIYSCYSKREITEKRLRQNIGNLEHNLEMIKKESELRTEQMNKELIKTKEQNKKAFADLDVLMRDVASLKKQLSDCQQRLEE